MLNNLLSNAAKFTHRGTISVSAAYHGPGREWVAVSVRDSGIGVPRDKMESIFLPFEQVGTVVLSMSYVFGCGGWVWASLRRAARQDGVDFHAL